VALATEGQLVYRISYALCTLLRELDADMYADLQLYGEAEANRLVVENKLLGADKGVLLNGHPACTMSRHETWKHLYRRDIINVAPGMDVLLALGVAWIRTDKQKQDEKAAVSAAA